jgi:formylglycine-generating enzyme required for sulfatase activity
MVLIPAGPFLFGKDLQELHLDDYFIDIYPVTNDEYRRFVIAADYKEPSHWRGRFDSKTAKLPVVNVGWKDAMAYCKWANKELPTNEHWEKAARGPEGKKYPWGRDYSTKNCNVRESGLGKLTPVDKFPKGKSHFDCFDMLGNVYEWTQETYFGDENSRCLRGCSYRSYLGCADWVTKGLIKPDSGRGDIGFRCVMSLETWDTLRA